jgi:rubrerythrin
MNLLNFIDKFDKINPNVETQAEEATSVLSRRHAFRQFGSIAKDAALLAIPFGAAMMTPSRAMAQVTNPTIVDVLNFALTLEYLESEFYAMGLDTNGLLTGDARSVVEQISKHEDAHVSFLTTTITSLNGTPVTKPSFDFTANGNFPTVFSSADTFFALAQAFEDTGVRAYKGQAGNLLGTGDVLQAALQIHSVEARHASEVRRLRGSKGWITQAVNTTAPAAAPVYAGEDNTTHLGVDFKPVVTVGDDALTEAFDEPLTKDQVLAIASLFIN